MIVCVCNAITEDELRALARSGARTTEEAYALLGHEPQCGSCLTYAQELIDEQRRRLPRPKLRVVA
jgi:bacterioferritin-associated ferredoxin